MRRPEPLHAAALLVDQDGRMPAKQIAKGLNEISNLPGELMLRLKRMKPQGSAARKNARSSADKFSPATPEMKARTGIEGGCALSRSGGQGEVYGFLWMRQLPPADFSAEQTPLASEATE